MPNFFNDIVAVLFIWMYVTYTNNQRQEIGGVWQEVSRVGQEVSGMIQEGQAIFDYEVEVLIYILLIWMTMEGAELPYPVQAEQDPQEGMEEYYQRVVSGHIR